MVKTNEIILIVGAAIAAYLFTSNTSKSSNVSVINPFHDLRNQAQAQIVNQNQNNISTLESVRQSNLGIADNILTSERNIADLLIARQQTELDRTQSYVSGQQKIGAAAGFSSLAPPGDWQNAAGSLLRKFSQAQPGGSLFPDFRLINNATNYGIVAQQSRYETAQSNIKSANQSIMQQQAEIDRVNEEYRINYGDISRYG
tara:strand:- start:70 stop:672 length:603 start_codon:yes stop_codon:yes gene_type:complete